MTDKPDTPGTEPSPEPKPKAKPKAKKPRRKPSQWLLGEFSSEQLTEMLEQALRFAARWRYVTDKDQIGLDALANLPEFRRVSMTRLRKWAEEDGWATLRRQEMADWRRKLEDIAKTRLMEQNRRALRDIEHLRRQAIEMLDNEALGARSWDTVASTLMQATKAQAELQARMVDAMGRGIETSPADAIVDDAVGRPALIPEEALKRIDPAMAREAAHYVLNKQRAGLLERLRIDPKGNPQPEVVDDADKPG